MTTAHRPTFEPARGGTGRNEGDLSKLSQQYSSKDMPSHTKLKYRQKGQGHADEIRSKDLRRELEEKERVSRDSRERRGRESGWSASGAGSSSSSSKKARLEQLVHNTQDEDDSYDEVDDDLRRELEEKERVSRDSRERRGRESGWSASGAGSSSSSSKKARLEQLVHNTQDEDDSYDEVDDELDSDEDDTAELMAELARIKKERALEKAQRDALVAEEQERIRTENILHGNPLLNPEPADFKVKRRWDDDVVFKNCAKGLEERKKEPAFINDAIRSEFHRKFMEKYIK
ncbi:Protein CWC15 -like protein [Toxocara canis]|uniref:Protein CWC15-like protein n=1 Tax=Toxocara canis TaxID=6265 RepID=A0A0B2V4A0_TOXCA|nr:Protein CWC15 -like protein [Toxocara canis]